VFDLLNGPDGQMPIRMHPAIELKDAKGEPTGDWSEPEPWFDRDGNPVHADFAPDGEVINVKRGPFRGERFSGGWMREVPKTTPLGIYPLGTEFGDAGEQKAVPIQRIIRSADEPANLPRMTMPRGPINRVHRAG